MPQEKRKCSFAETTSAHMDANEDVFSTHLRETRSHLDTTTGHGRPLAVLHIPTSIHKCVSLSVQCSIWYSSLVPHLCRYDHFFLQSM